MTAEVAEIRTHVDDLLEEVKGGEPVEIVVRNAAVAEVAPMPKHYAIFEDGRVVDQTRGYERIEQLVREGKLKHGFRPLPDDFLTRELVEMPGVVGELLRDRHGNDNF
jgi:antitoxin (DNA-binding transcriptional repressor) of toxin-antitoxin stability system